MSIKNVNHYSVVRNVIQSANVTSWYVYLLEPGLPPQRGVATDCLGSAFVV